MLVRNWSYLLMWTNTMLGGGVRCEGMKMQKTAALMQDIATAVAILSFCEVAFRSEMIEIRLMMICMRNWTSKT